MFFTGPESTLSSPVVRRRNKCPCNGVPDWRQQYPYLLGGPVQPQTKWDAIKIALQGVIITVCTVNGVWLVSKESLRDLFLRTWCNSHFRIHKHITAVLYSGAYGKFCPHFQYDVGYSRCAQRRIRSIWVQCSWALWKPDFTYGHKCISTRTVLIS
jgi:hypothetical protein